MTSESRLFENPILPGFHPDPSICRVGENYYLVNSSFAYFPGVPVYHSRDLVHWRQIGHCLDRPSQLQLVNAGVSGGIFAPTIRWHDGVYYMITTNVSGGGNFYVTARDPAGPWSEPIWVSQPGIDPSLLFDGDHVYLTSSGIPEDPEPGQHTQGIIQSEIDIATGKLLTRPRLIWAGTGGAFAEGPHLYHIGDWYYLMIAEGGTEYGHTEVIARSSSPWGPWESCQHNPILTHRSVASPIQGLGHADLVEAHDGSWWVVCLGFRPNFPQAHHLGRETFLAPAHWDEHGWLKIGEAGCIRLNMEAPNLAPAVWAAQDVRDDFIKEKLGLQWNFLGVPQEGDWSLSFVPGALTLRGRTNHLDGGLGVVFVGRRQEHFNCEVTAALHYSPLADGDEAGLVVWMDERHRAEIYLMRQDGRRSIFLRRRIGSLSAITSRQDLSDSDIILSVRANRSFYSFTWRGADGIDHFLGTAETRYLSSEVAGGFTGVYFALFTSGSGSPVVVDWFDYRSLETTGQKSIESPLREIFADQRAFAVLQRCLPDLTKQPPTGWISNFSLVDLVSISPDTFTQEAILNMDSGLRRLHAEF